MFSLLRPSPSSAAAGLSVARCIRGFSHSSTSYKDITKLTISGKLFKAPELSTTSNGRQCIRYTVRSHLGGEKTNFFNFLSLTENAKSIEYLTGVPRGSKVVAEGEFSPYILAREDGSKEYKYSIFSNSLHVIERAKVEVPSEATEAQEAPATPTEGGQAPATPTESGQAPATPTEGGQAPATPTEGGQAPATPTESGQAPATPTEGGQAAGYQA